MTFLRYLFLLCLIFLQSGYSYYVSFQVLALLLLILIILLHGSSFKISMFGTFSILLFISFTLNTGFFSPLIISSNSTNIYVTVLALLAYALIIFSFTLLYINRYEDFLLFFWRVASSLILAIFITLIVSEINFTPLLNREFFIIQNASLIDNFTSIKNIEVSLRFQHKQGVDLFYGEPSFLAIVIFASLGCFVIANEGLKNFSTQISVNTSVARLANKFNVIPLIGIASLIYIQSLTSIICAAVAIFFSFSMQEIFKRISYVKIVFFLIVTIIFIVSSSENVSYRIDTLGQSTSFAQRFGFLSEMGPVDWFIGFKDQYKLPEAGIHNGLIYLITISGVGGIAYFFYLIRHAYTSATIIGQPLYYVLTILAIFMQNGGIFSPSKIVLMSLILLPLAAVRSAKIDLIRGIRSGFDR